MDEADRILNMDFEQEVRSYVSYLLSIFDDQVYFLFNEVYPFYSACISAVCLCAGGQNIESHSARTENLLVFCYNDVKGRHYDTAYNVFAML